MTIKGLSIAANVLQIVGFADIVSKAGASLYEIFNKAKGASKDIALLLSELQALLRVVANIRVFLGEHATSPFVNEDSYCLQTINTILTLIEQYFRYLQSLISRIAPVQPKAWYSALTNGIRWALGHDEVYSACRRLGR
jgi:hypothetical protein